MAVQQPSQPVSDQDRERIAEEIAAALLLLYSGRRAQALRRLGVTDQSPEPPPEAVQKINAFATDRAQKIQDGINSRMLGADEPQAVAQDIATYNATILQPFMESYASHEALMDTYTTTPASDGSGTAAESKQWVWTQRTDFDDECREADGASPAPLLDLLAITGGSPPLHERCACTLDPA